MTQPNDSNAPDADAMSGDALADQIQQMLDEASSESGAEPAAVATAPRDEAGAGAASDEGGGETMADVDATLADDAEELLGDFETAEEAMRADAPPPAMESPAAPATEDEASEPAAAEAEESDDADGAVDEPTTDATDSPEAAAGDDAHDDDHVFGEFETPEQVAAVSDAAEAAVAPGAEADEPTPATAEEPIDDDASAESPEPTAPQAREPQNIAMPEPVDRAASVATAASRDEAESRGAADDEAEREAKGGGWLGQAGVMVMMVMAAINRPLDGAPPMMRDVIGFIGLWHVGLAASLFAFHGAGVIGLIATLTLTTTALGLVFYILFLRGVKPESGGEAEGEGESELAEAA